MIIGRLFDGVYAASFFHTRDSCGFAARTTKEPLSGPPRDSALDALPDHWYFPGDFLPQGNAKPGENP